MSSSDTRWDHFPHGADISVRIKRASYAKVGISFILLLWCTVASTSAQQQEVTLAGKNEYQQYCAVCHGRDGTGAGAMAKLLKVKPANLTRLSVKHDGIFPFWDVYRIIDGRKEIGGHGSGDMPIWGTVFKQERGADLGAELSAHARILEIVYYLESRQVPPRGRPSVLAIVANTASCIRTIHRSRHSTLSTSFPRSMVGLDHLDNLALACIDCNLKKGANLTGIDPETNEITLLFHPRRH